MSAAPLGAVCALVERETGIPEARMNKLRKEENQKTRKKMSKGEVEGGARVGTRLGKKTKENGEGGKGKKGGGECSSVSHLPHHACR